MISLLFLAVTATSPPQESLQRTVSLMGTSFHVDVEGVPRSQALAASEAAVRALEETELRLSTWREDTELSLFNRASPAQTVSLSPELASELAEARLCWKETGGSFDPGAGRLFQAWGLRTGGRQPKDTEIETALRDGGMANLVLNGREARRSSGLILEEGAFGKGAGLDRALAAARAAAPEARIRLDAGGQLAVTGGGWTVAVAHPQDRDQAVLELTLDNGSVATSGNSERGLEVDGRRFSHLIDPRSGRPALDFGSLTVVADTALRADCLATGLYVQGPDAALSWVAATEGVEALVLERTAEGLRARVTPGLHGSLRPLLPGLAVEAFPSREEEKPAGGSLGEDESTGEGLSAGNLRKALSVPVSRSFDFASLTVAPRPIGPATAENAPTSPVTRAGSPKPRLGDRTTIL